MNTDNLAEAKANLELFVLKNKDKLWEEELEDLEKAFKVLNRFKT